MEPIILLPHAMLDATRVREYIEAVSRAFVLGWSSKEKTMADKQQPTGPTITWQPIPLFVGLEGMSRKQIGRRLRSLRLRQGATPEQIEDSGQPRMPRGQILCFERGELPIDAPVLCGLAVAFRMPLDAFSDWICSKKGTR